MIYPFSIVRKSKRSPIRQRKVDFKAINVDLKDVCTISLKFKSPVGGRSAPFVLHKIPSFMNDLWAELLGRQIGCEEVRSMFLKSWRLVERQKFIFDHSSWRYGAVNPDLGTLTAPQIADLIITMTCGLKGFGSNCDAEPFANLSEAIQNGTFYPNEVFDLPDVVIFSCHNLSQLCAAHPDMSTKWCKKFASILFPSAASPLNIWDADKVVRMTRVLVEKSTLLARLRKNGNPPADEDCKDESGTCKEGPPRLSSSISHPPSNHNLPLHPHQASLDFLNDTKSVSYHLAEMRLKDPPTAFGGTTIEKIDETTPSLISTDDDHDASDRRKNLKVEMTLSKEKPYPQLRFVPGDLMKNSTEVRQSAPRAKLEVIVEEDATGVSKIATTNRQEIMTQTQDGLDKKPKTLTLAQKVPCSLAKATVKGGPEVKSAYAKFRFAGSGFKKASTEQGQTQSANNHKSIDKLRARLLVRSTRPQFEVEVPVAVDNTRRHPNEE